MSEKQKAETSLSVAKPSESKEKLLSQASIWVVDDEGLVGDVTKMMLEGLGYKDVTFLNGSQQALSEYQKAIRENKSLPDLVVSDFNMPGLNGDELYRQMKSVSGDKTPPFIVVSGAVTLQEGEQLAELGVSSVLSKPFGLKDLEKVVCKGLKSR